MDQLRELNAKLLKASITRSKGILTIHCIETSCLWTADVEPNRVMGTAGELVARRMLWKHYKGSHAKG